MEKQEKSKCTILEESNGTKEDEVSNGTFSGGLFHPADDKQEVAFRYAVEKINNDRTILPRSKLSAQIEKMSPQDSFHASKKGKACRNICPNGATEMSLFSPHDPHRAGKLEIMENKGWRASRKIASCDFALGVFIALLFFYHFSPTNLVFSYSFIFFSVRYYYSIQHNYPIDE